MILYWSPIECIAIFPFADPSQNIQFSSYEGISIKLDPAKYGKWGNCQFEAIGDQLDVSGDIVRQQVVNYMRNNASKFEQFYTDNELCWTDYLHKMTDTSTFGLTIQAAAYVYRVTFVICDAADEGRSLHF